MVEKKLNEEEEATMEEESCRTGENMELIVFKHVYMQGDGEGERLAVGEMVEELIPWDPFFKKFKSEGKEKVRYKKAEFVKWMKANFPDVEMTNPHNYPHFSGLKRKQE